MVKAPGEMRDVSLFLGTFEGPGETRAESVFGKHRLRRTIESQLCLDGFWQVMRFRDTSPEANFPPIRGDWQLSYDQTKKVFIALWTDNSGHWAHMTSAGWQGDTLMFVSSGVAGERMSVRDTFVKKSGSAMLMMVDYKMAGEDWIRSIEYDLHRVDAS
jgi:hypothetical protein